MLKKIIGLLIVGALFAIFACIVTAGVDRVERVECQAWQAQAKRFTEFYYTEWQKAQCNID